MRCLLALLLVACQQPARPTTPVAPVVPVTPPVARPDPMVRARPDLREHDRACRQDREMSSCMVIGIFYWSGSEQDGIARDWPEAVSLLGPACTARVPEACAALIQILEAGGFGVERDPTRAAAVHQQLCDDGFDQHCRNRDEPPPLEP